MASKNEIKSVYLFFGLITLMFLLSSSCSSNHENFKTKLKKHLNENPEIITEVIKNHPDKFMMAFQNAYSASQKKMALEKQKEEQRQLESYYINPLKPQITKKDVFFGPKDAPITIVEYTDFECPFCARGKANIQELLKKYPGKIKILYKHLPLSFHPNAFISAQYFEAILIQSPKLAKQFYDQLFSNQQKLKKGGEKYLKKLAKQIGVNLKRLSGDLKSQNIKDKIQANIKEANSFNINGTPGYILNGVAIKGAYPEEYFVNIINELISRKKIEL